MTRSEGARERGARQGATARPGVRTAWALAALVAAGCAGTRYSRMAPPDGASALGVEFGADRDAVVRALRASGVAVRDAAGDPDAVVADRCPSAPAAVPCRLFFGPQGLYAAQLDVPASDAGALRGAVQRGLGAPDGVEEPAPPVEGLATVLAAWHRPAWTVTVSRSPPNVTPATAMLRVEHDPAAPPVVAGVPLGRIRDDVELALERQGAVLVDRDEGTSTYLGCPLGDPEALSCLVLFRAGRAAAVTEIHPAPSTDREALAAWRTLARRLERDIGRAPRTSCPDAGPDRVAGDCTATWTSDRLVVTVGAHRNAGGSHRGTISVYTAFTYPALPAAPDEDAVERR